MKALKGTLTFIMGMIVGIILFVVAIGGAVFAVAATISVGDLQNKLGVNIVDKDSQIIDDSLWDVVVELIDDIQNLDKLTIQKLVDKYGLPIPKEVSGIDITPIFGYPLLTVPDHLGDIVNAIKLRDISELTGIDFSKLPIMTENLDNNIKDAFDILLNSIDGETMTVRKIQENFGFSFGDGGILDIIKDAPMNSFGSLINGITIGMLMDADLDRFVSAGVNEIFVKPSETERYELVASTEYGNVKHGAATYVSGSSDGQLIQKELRFIKKTIGETEVFSVDYASNGWEFTPGENSPDYYRLIEFKPYDSSANYPADTEYFVPAYANAVELISGGYGIKSDGFMSLKDIYTDNSAANSFNTLVSNNVITLDNAYYKTETETVKAEDFGFAEELLNKDSKLIEGNLGYLRARLGTASPLIQTVAPYTVNTIGDVQSEIMNIKIKDLIKITEDSAQFLKSNQDKTLKEITENFDSFTLGDIMTVDYGAYVPDNDGSYVYIEDGSSGYYTLFNPELHDADLQKYAYIDGYTVAKAEDKENSEITLYFYNQATKSMTAYIGGDQGTLYVQKAPSSKVLQRLASVSVGGFAGAFDTLVLGDVLDVSVDTYSKHSVIGVAGPAFVPGNDYYYFDSETGSYASAAVFDNAFLTANQGKQIYTLKTFGASNAVLKRLALIKVNDLGSKMTGIIDSLAIGDMLEIKTSAYVPDDNGKYIYAANGGYYTLFDIAAYPESTQRYAKIDGYVFASAEQIAANIGLYNYDNIQKQMTACQNTDPGPYFVQGDASAALLQRYGKVRINGFSDALDNTAIGELLSVDVDIYTVASADFITNNPSVKFYRYDRGLYLTADAAYRGSHPAETYYYIEEGNVGGGNNIIKKMANLKLSEMDSRMSEIIDDISLSDVITVYENSRVESDLSPETDETGSRWIIPHNPHYSETDRITGENKYFTFAYHSDGRYYRTSVMYVKALDGQKTPTGTAEYVYRSLDGYNQQSYLTFVATEKMSGNDNPGYLYYKTDNEYVYNPAVTSYLLAQGQMGKLYYRSAPGEGDASADIVSVPLYSSNANLYVINEILNKYEAYNANVFAHGDSVLYFKYENGYFIASEEVIQGGTETLYSFNSSTGVYTEDSGSAAIKYVKLIAEDGKYYYSPLDSGYKKGVDITFAKQPCETIYKKDANGEFVYVNGKYAHFNPENASHATAERYTPIMGYLANINENSVLNADNERNLLLSSDKVKVLQQKSELIMIALCKGDTTIASLGNTVNKLTLGNIMPIAENSMFSQFKDCTLNELDRALSDKISNLKIGELIELANISTVSANVKALLKDVKIADLVGSLVYDTSGLRIDIAKLFKIS